MRAPLLCLAAALIAHAPPTSSLCRMKRAATAAGTIAYRDCGRGAPVIVIPGGPGLDADYIAPLARMIADAGHRAILIEPRGTGASRAALGDGSRLTVAGSVADVEAVRRASGVDRATILGHSFGGAVAQAYAAAHGNRVADLVLLDSVGPDMSAPHHALEGWRDRLTPATLHAYDAARSRGDRRAAMRIKFGASFYHAARGAAFLASLTDAAIHLDVAPLSESYARDFHVGRASPPRPFQVAIVAGDIDWIRGYEPALHATYPGARRFVIRHAGHFPWADAPAATRLVLERVLHHR